MKNWVAIAREPRRDNVTKKPAARTAGFSQSGIGAQCARIASSSSATMLVILIIG